MLVLARKEKEEVVLSMDDKIIGIVHLVEVRERGSVARLGFSLFDQSIRIDRREVFEKNQERIANAADQ